jgi:hypothetical protein
MPLDTLDILEGTDVAGMWCTKRFGSMEGAVVEVFSVGWVCAGGAGAAIWTLGSIDELETGVFGRGTGVRRKSGLGMGGSDFAGRTVSFVGGAVGVSGSNTAGRRVNVG